MSLSRLYITALPYVPQATLLLLSSRSLGFQPSPLLVPFLLSLLLHLLSSPSLSTLSLLPLSLGIALSFFSEIYSALGSKSEAALTLGLMGLVVGTGVVGVVGGWNWVEGKWLRGKEGRKVLQMVGFPVVWSLGWMSVARLSPFGKQGSWTPTHGFLFDSLSPLIKIFGPASVDFVVAALAVLLFKALHPLLPSSSNVNGHPTHHQDLVRFEEPVEPYRDDPTAQTTSITNGHSHSDPQPTSARFLTLSNGLLLFLAFNLLPTFIPPPQPSPQSLSTHTPLSLACILPPDPSSSSSSGESNLDRFLAESRRVASSARVLLWPEGEIQVENQQAFEIAMEKVGTVSRGSEVWIGVGVVGRWDDDGDEGEEERKKKKSNGMVLVGPEGKVVGGNRKSKTIPVAESFSISSHPNPPPILTLPLQHPSHISRSQWASAETNYTRSVHLTSLICNDLNFPNLLNPSIALSTSLTLVPSSTWYTPIGLSLLSQARFRALESSSPVLLCDGNPHHTGVSGFVDDWGRVRNWQVGGGSFVVKWDVQGTGGEVRKRGGRWGVFWGYGWVGEMMVGLLVVASGVEWVGWTEGGRERRRRVGEMVGRLGGRVWWVLRGERREREEEGREERDQGALI